MALPVDYNNQAVEMPGTRRPGQTGIYRRSGYESRLLEIPKRMPNARTVYDAFQHGLSINPDADCLGERKYDPDTRSFGEYEWQSYATVNARLTRFGSGLAHLYEEGFSGSDAAAPLQQLGQWTVGIWGPNRREWTIAGAGCCAYSMVSVGLFDALDIDAIVYIINHSEIPAVVASANHIVELLKNADKMPGLKIIISMDRLRANDAEKFPGCTSVAPDVAFRAWANEKNIRILEFDEVEELGELHARKHNPPKPDDVYTIAYTSGTTGVPKGAMATHANYVAYMAASEDAVPMNTSDTVFNFSPLGHVFGRMVEAMAFSTGARAGFGSGSPLRLLEDAKALRPTIMPMVPRLLNRVYFRLKASTMDAPGWIGTLSRRAFADKLSNLNSGKGVYHALWDRLLFNKVRQVLGGNIRYIVTGSAPISSEILAFCKVALCCEILEVYGQTENCGGGTVVSFGEVTLGHVGPPTPSSEIKLVDVPELNYFSTDEPFPRGEICVRGPVVIKGYLKDEEKTREAIDEDGFLHSGDIALLNPNGTFTIIDRVKNIFKLSQGEYVAAEKIENQLLASVPLIQQIFIHGDSHENCLVSIVVPEPEAFLPLVKQILNEDISPSDPSAIRDACGHPEIRNAVLQMITDAGKAGNLKGFEIPRAVILEPTPFSIENGRVTPTLKIKRHAVAQEYREQITAMYRELQ
ncbi:hypothetical protein BGZ73_003515 [Actinomortierella ambigua]|nr:hypothetical protein BGZ73_003515 [Actinomortierella ambigua]